MPRRTPQTANDLEVLAKMCGRRMRAGGNHPLWVADHFPHRPLPIARRGGNQAIPAHARKVILDGLEADAAAWEEALADVEHQGHSNGMER